MGIFIGETESFPSREIINVFLQKESYDSPKKFHFRLTFEILHLPGALRLEQNQKTAKRLCENLSERVWG